MNEEKIRKKTLAIITGPYQLLQAIWYYSVYPGDEYYALLKDADINSSAKSKLEEQCRSSGIFSEIRVLSGVTIDSNLVDRVKLFIKMLYYYICGKRNKLTRALINQETDERLFDKVIVDSENSIIGGAFIDNADLYETIIMQEGLSDVVTRKDHLKLSKKDIIGYVLAKMDYCNPAFYYKLSGTKNCDKMSSFPSLVDASYFKSIIRLYSDQNPELFSSVLKRTFVTDNWSIVKNADIILFTAPLEHMGAGKEHNEAVHHWLKDNYFGRKIVIKKHPRDHFDYQWEDLDLAFLGAEIPAEVLLTQLADKQLLFMFISTCIVDILETQLDYSIFHFSSIKDSYYNDVFPMLINKLQISERHIVTL